MNYIDQSRGPKYQGIISSAMASVDEIVQAILVAKSGKVKENRLIRPQLAFGFTVT